MATYHTYKEFGDFEQISAALDAGSPIYHIVRPILVHGRNASGSPCLCGCESRKAVVKRTIPHIEMLLERQSGARVFRDKDNAEWFDAKVAEGIAERIDMPHVCTESQYHIVRDFRHCLRRGRFRKACVAFGGNRSGKTTSTNEIAVDIWLIKGGPGRILLFVSPTLEKCTTPLKKLINGEGTDRYIRPMIDPRLVMSKPKRGKIEKDGDKAILVDGTEFQFRHGSGDGDNLKSMGVIAIFMDELCAIRNAGNWLVAVGRTIDSGACIFGSTTPKQGHWAKEEIYNGGVKIEDAGDEDDIVWTHLKCQDNAFVSPQEIERARKMLNDERLARRDIDGEWVPDGLTYWEYWDGRDMEHGGMTFDGPWQPEAHGFTNITERALGHAFKRCKATRLDHFGGIDFNMKPMSMIDMQIVVKDGQNQDNPANWCLWIPHEVVRDGGVLKFADYLETAAHRELGLDDDWFEGMALACDSTGAQRNNEAATRHGISNLSSSLVDFLKVRGHDARACNLSDNGNPANPDQIKCCGLVHKLMRDGRLFVHRTRCKKLIHGFEAQEQTSDGRIHKEPGKFTDKLSGPPDGCRYGAWAVLARHEPEFNRKIRYAA